jgi:predicted metal-binding transcription factor (methanogenesis marker protein 9)
MKRVLSILFFAFLFIGISLTGTSLYSQSKEKGKKVTETKATKPLPLRDDTEDHIRCDEETYKKYSELRPRYLEIQRKIGEIDAKLKANERNLETLKNMSEEEIEKEVREENIKKIEEENEALKASRKKIEEEGIEFYKIYEPIRHKCED